MYNFDAKIETARCIDWIKNYFKNNGPTSKVIIGLSGGKDSSITAALCVKALGSDRILGVYMPNGDANYKDIKCIDTLSAFLNIEVLACNITEAVNSCYDGLKKIGLQITDQILTNHPARIRMSMLYAIAASCGGRVVNTCNLSEDYVGYSTKYGDSAGDFSPLGGMTVTEVKQIGYELGLPIDLVDRTPEDGMCGKSDEENLGFSYDLLDRVIRETVVTTSEEVAQLARINILHKNTRHKYNPMPHFEILNK